MGNRPTPPEAVVGAVLLKSRRRCCLCVFLQKDHETKKGQIAHLDRNPSNNSEDNLAFLCLAHHDEYDTTTSVSKGITLAEVKRYRDLLYDRNLKEDVGNPDGATQEEGYSIPDDDKARLSLATTLYLESYADRYQSFKEDGRHAVVNEAMSQFENFRKKWRMPRRVFEFYMTICLEERRLIHMHEFIATKRIVEFVARHREFGNDVGTWLAANVAGIDMTDR